MGRDKDAGPCPSYGRPPTFEYRIESAKCRLWQIIGVLLFTQADISEIRDCMRETAKRIRALETELADTAASEAAAQRALARHHNAQTTVAATFRDGARIE